MAPRFLRRYEMAERLMDRSCEEFACDLASKVSVPGGGGAAAYVGALGAALASMVGHYTTGKKLYARYEEDVQEDIGKADHIRERLIELADMDAAAFYPLSKAYSIPKDDPDRTDIIERATKKACAAPIEMMRQTCKAIAILEDMYTKGTRMLLSDVGCGALFCRAARGGGPQRVREHQDVAGLFVCQWPRGRVQHASR